MWERSRVSGQTVPKACHLKLGLLLSFNANAQYQGALILSFKQRNGT